MRKHLAFAVLAVSIAGSSSVFAAATGPGSDVVSDSVIDVIDITGSEADNQVRVSYLGAQRYRITDTAGITGAGCDQPDATTVECTNDAETPHVWFTAYGGTDHAEFALPIQSVVTAEGGSRDAIGPPGDDTFEIAIGALARARFSGYLGADTLIGGRERDFLSGGRGPDDLIGRGGDDRLLGAQQPDTFRGGAGDDTIQAARGDRDDTIRCGGGRDLAVVDRKIDPAPRHCETVRFR